jgi:hypothetical protein
LKHEEFTSMLNGKVIPYFGKSGDDSMAEKHDVLAVILGGGAGTRLFPLTQRRSKPAVPLAGKYRLVDIPPHRADLPLLALLGRLRRDTRR